MFSTILVALAVVVLLAVGVVVGVFGKSIVEGVKSGLAKRKVNREIAEDREVVMSDGVWYTSDRKVKAKWNNGHLVYIGLTDGIKYDTFFEFLDNEVMEMSTALEVQNAQRRFEQAASHVEKEMYKPAFRTEYDTELELGKKLYVYKKGVLVLSDNVMVYIDEIDGGLDVTQVAYALGGLNNKTSPRHELNFIVSEDNPQEDVNIFMDKWAHYLATHPAEQELAKELEEHLSFYNETMADGQVEIVNNRVVIKAKTLKQGFFEENVVKVKRSPFELALKDAQRYQRAEKATS